MGQLVQVVVGVGRRRAWTALSRAGHHHAYELSPTAAELGTWLESVDVLVRFVAKRVA
jgi:hypothetical protein